MSSQTLTMMERKLKEEINAEAEGYDAMILVHETEVGAARPPQPIEAFDKNPLQEEGSSDIRARWRPTRTTSDGGRGGANVLTAREMFGQIRREGYRIEYHRIPFSRIRDVTPDDFDAVRAALAPRAPGGGGEGVKVLFMSHIGYGSVGYGMSIAASSSLGGGAAAPGREGARAALGAASLGPASPPREPPGVAELLSPVIPPRAPGPPAAEANGTGLHPFRAGNTSVSSFLRLLSSGLRAKERADDVLFACRRNGCIIDDIRYCQRILDGGGRAGDAGAHGEWAMMVQRARSFLKKYYQVYMMLIAYNAYLLQGGEEAPVDRSVDARQQVQRDRAATAWEGDDDADGEEDEEDPPETFAVWFASRPELRHFLDRIEP